MYGCEKKHPAGCFFYTRDSGQRAILTCASEPAREYGLPVDIYFAGTPIREQARSDRELCCLELQA
jgi:hypothetical protein